MKQICSSILLIAGIVFSASAQTNKTYKTDMSTDRIYNDKSSTVTQQSILLNTGSNNPETRGAVKMNQVQQFQGSRTVAPDRRDGFLSADQMHNEITRDDLPYRSIPYDTSKNNGHCIGCGSGTMTDPHPWK